jgi:hypothetical protein
VCPAPSSTKRPRSDTADDEVRLQFQSGNHRRGILWVPFGRCAGPGRKIFNLLSQLWLLQPENGQKALKIPAPYCPPAGGINGGDHPFSDPFGAQVV